MKINAFEAALECDLNVNELVREFNKKDLFDISLKGTRRICIGV